MINVDLIIDIPRGCFGRLAPRSGLSIRESIDVAGGVMDTDYRGSDFGKSI